MIFFKRPYNTFGRSLFINLSAQIILSHYKLTFCLKIKGYEKTKAWVIYERITTQYGFNPAFYITAQLNFSGPNFVFAKFWEVLEKLSGS